jgi:NAD(P)H-dependent FMN reductase
LVAHREWLYFPQFHLLEPAAAATAITANVVQIGATAVQHALQPNPGALGVDTVGTGIAEASKAIPRYGKLVAPVVNEVNESVKNSSVGQAIQNWINERLKK